MKQKIVKLIGLLASTCLALYPIIIGDRPSFLFFGELPIPKE